jgi:acetoin utilization transport system permease protein
MLPQYRNPKGGGVLRVSDISKLAWDQVKRRKVVTGLCMAGISIGCAAIIVALSIGESAQSYTEKTMNQSFKMDEITVTPNGGIPTQGGEGGGAPEASDKLDPGKLTRQKLEIIQGLKHVSAATPFQELGYFQMYTIDNRIADVKVIGTDLRLLEKYDKTFMQGGASDLPGMAVLNYGATLGLIDAETRQNIFDGMESDPFNNELREQYDNLSVLPSQMYQQQIQFQSQNFTSTLAQTHISSPLRVSGILIKASGTNDMMASYDKIIYVSLETAERLAEELNLSSGTAGQEGVYNSVIVKVDSSDNIEQVEKLIQKLTLTTSTNLFQKEQLADTFNMVKKAALGVGVFILIIASISIIVAMTMSTHQRRRQIGIMKVLGANMRQIRNMFITEAALLGLLGGILGVIISYLIVFGINKLIGAGAGPDAGDSLIIYIPIMTIPVGIAFAVMTGILSGIYPAISASRTNALTAIKRD